MNVTTDAVIIFTDDKRYLAVRFEADEAENNMNARFLQFASPNDVSFFIEPGL